MRTAYRTPKKYEDIFRRLARETDTCGSIRPPEIYAINEKEPGDD